MGPEKYANFNKNELIGVWDSVVDKFTLDGKVIDSPKHPCIECDPHEASQSNPHHVIEFAKRIGAIYNHPEKGEMIVISINGELGASACTEIEIMELFG